MSSALGADRARGSFGALTQFFLEGFVRHRNLEFEEAARGRIVGALSAVAGGAGVAMFYILRAQWLSTGGAMTDAWAAVGGLIAFGMAGAGILAALLWDTLGPGESDRELLLPLPLRPGRVGLAKATASVIFAGLFSLALAIFTSPICGMFLARGRAWSAIRHAAAVGVAIFFANVSVFLLCGVLHAFTLLLGSAWNRRVRGVLLTALLGASAALLALLPEFAGGLPARVRAGDAALRALPPAWFTGVYGVLAGDGPSALADLASFGAATTVSLALLYPVLLVAGFSSSLVPRAGAAGRRKTSRPGFRSPATFFLRDSVTRAADEFFAATLARAADRVRLRGPVAAGLFIVLVNQFSTVADDLFALPVLGFCTLVGVFNVTRRPVQEGANWIFRLAEPLDPSAIGRGFTSAVWWRVLFPLHLVVGALIALRGRADRVVAPVMVYAALSLLLLVLIASQLRRFPFACSSVASRVPPVLSGLRFLVLLAIYTNVALLVEDFAGASVGRSVVVWLIVLGVSMVLLRMRGERRPGLLYEDPGDRPLELNLSVGRGAGPS